MSIYMMWLSHEMNKGHQRGQQVIDWVDFLFHDLWAEIEEMRVWGLHWGGAEFWVVGGVWVFRRWQQARHRKHGGGRAVGGEVESRSRSFKASLASIRTLDFILSRHELPAGSIQRRGVFWFPFRKDQTVPMNGKLKTVHQSGTEV